MFRKTPRTFSVPVSSALLALMILLSACNVPADLPSPVPAEATMEATAPDEPTQVAGQSGIQVTLDVSVVAQNVSSQVVEAVPSVADHPWWEAMPAHTVLTLQGYPISGHLMQPKIFVYPVQELGVNEVAGQVPQSLQALLQSRQPGDSMPYLPPYNAAQVMHAQVQFLDFKNGQGVRYLTQFDQAMLPINNHELHYTFQGLTSDGKYYVAAVLPVNLPGLPEKEYPLDNPPANFTEDFPKYLSDTVDMLNGQPASAFTPDLSVLDAMMGSLEVK